MNTKRKRTSHVWNYFTVDSNTNATCKLCGRKYSYKSTNSNLKKHILRKHPTVNVKIPLPSKNIKPTIPKIRCTEKLTQESCPSNSFDTFELQSPTSKTTEQANAKLLNLNATNSDQTPNSKSAIDSKLMLLFIVDMQPFHIVEDTGFKTFVNTLNPGYSLPTKHTLSNSMMPILFEKCKNAVIRVLAEVEFICITTDCWTSVNNDRVIAITGHFVNNDYILKSVLLDCVALAQSHTSENFAHALKNVVKEWGLGEKVILGVSCNASTAVKAIRDILQWPFLGCMSHTMNLVVETGIKNVDSLILKIKTIVSHLKRSPALNEKLINYQTNSNLEAKKLLQAISPKWNSTYLMLKRFCELEDAIKDITMKENLSILTEIDWKMAKELIMVLKPFFEVSESLRSKNYSTCSIAIMLSNGLLNVCHKLQKKPLTEQVATVVNSLEQEVLNWMGSYDQNKLLCVAMFLDPRFKACFSSIELAEQVRLMVVDYIAERLTKELSEKEKCMEKTVTVKQIIEEDEDEISAWSCLKQRLKNVPDVNPISKANDEVRRYLEEPSIDRTEDPLLWWQQNHFNYPNVNSLVKQHFCCLATAVPRERLFSKGSYIVSERRTRLSFEKVRKIMFINMNISHC